MPQDINIVFSRALMARVHNDVRKHFPQIAPMRAASVVGPHCKQYFVEIGVAGFGDFDGYYSADNAYEARAKAWMKFLEKHVPGYRDGEEETS